MDECRKALLEQLKRDEEKGISSDHSDPTEEELYDYIENNVTYGKLTFAHKVIIQSVRNYMIHCKKSKQKEV